MFIEQRKNRNTYLSKMLPCLCSPAKPLIGLSYWEQSLCRVPPSTVHPHGKLQCALVAIPIWGKKPHLLPCRIISLRRCLVLVPGLLRSSAVVNLHVCVQIRQPCWARAILDIFELEIVYSLNFLITIDLKCYYDENCIFSIEAILKHK